MIFYFLYKIFNLKLYIKNVTLGNIHQIEFYASYL